MTGDRLVTVLLTIVVPEAADAEDAASLLTLAAQSTAVDVLHAVGVEGHFALPGSTVLRGTRLYVVESVTATTAVITDLSGSSVEISHRALWPDVVVAADGDDLH